MLQALNTKLLIAVLIALSGISALLYTMHLQAEKNAAAIALQQAQEAKDRAEVEAWKAQADARRKKGIGAPGNESKTWQTYVP